MTYKYIYAYYCFFVFTLDTRTTQWEDPRLNNPKIAGPVSVALNYTFVKYLKIKNMLYVGITLFAGL